MTEPRLAPRLGAALALALLLPAQAPAQQAPGTQPVTGAECLSAQADAVTAETCTAAIAIEEDRITMEPNTRIERRPHALRLARGRATFEVKPRPKVEFRVRVKDGSQRVVRTSSRPVYEGNQVVGASGVMTDLTELRRTWSRLRAAGAHRRPGRASHSGAHGTQSGGRPDCCR